jgi:hypothetical protein
MRAKRMSRRRPKPTDSGSDKRGPGRPTTDPKTVRVELRLSEDDVAKIDELVNHRCSDRAAVIRALIGEKHARGIRRTTRG